MSINTETKLRPLADRILVKREKTEEKNFGGIILPDSAQKGNDVGIVIATGPGKRDEHGKCIAMSVAVGDKIMWAKYGAEEISVDGEDFLIVKENDVIAIVE
jgi:chaperonin GroES